VLADGTVDEAATAARRAELDTAAGAFTYGTARETFDARWPDALQSEVTALATAAPPVFRQALRLRLLAAAEAADAPADPDVLVEWLREQASGILDQLSPYAGKAE
jgi:hypothetical protein